MEAPKLIKRELKAQAKITEAANKKSPIHIQGAPYSTLNTHGLSQIDALLSTPPDLLHPHQTTPKLTQE